MERFRKFIDALSLSGAIILFFSIFIVIGVLKEQEKVWTTSFTALTTFVSGKHVGAKETKDDEDNKE
jgi:hypothetical protein